MLRILATSVLLLGIAVHPMRLIAPFTLPGRECRMV
jgi:hypothetical protein